MEKEVLVLMLLSVFSLMSLAQSPTKNYILERQMLDACGIQAIANISRMQWLSSMDHVLRGYDFVYDDLNRLEESTYAEGADMSQNKSSFDNNQNPTFHYYEKDHLASVRMVVNENGTIEQVSHYYPFGGVYGDLSYNSELQRNKYVGKEFDHMYGLDWYDHGARMYDAARVVWDRIDNSGEKNSDISPYLYCHDNAINKFDPDGNDDYFSNSGQFLFSKGDSPNIYVANGNNGFVNFNTLDLRRKNNLNTGVRIVGYYARKAGVKYNVNGGRGYVGISTLHRTDNQKDVLAQTKGESIYLKMSNGKLNKEMYNIYNLINTIGHEELHKESDVPLNYLVHSQIVLKQLADANFSNGSEKYQTGTIGNMIVLMN